MNLHFGLEGFLPTLLYLGGIAVFFASIFWRPTAGLYLLVFTLPLQTGRYRIHEFPLGDQFLDILLLGVILGMLTHGRKIEFKTPLSSVLFIIAAFYYVSLWQGAFYLNGPLPLAIDDPRFSDWKNYVEMFLLCIVVASVIKDKSQVQLLLLVMAFSVLLVNRSYYGTVSSRDLSHFSYESRYAGALGYAGENGFAAFEAMMAAFFLGIAAYVKRVPLKVGILGLVATSVYCLLFSFSRGGYLGFLVALVLLGVLKQRSLLIVVALVVISWETVLPVSVQERIMMTTQGAGETGENTGQGPQLDSSAQERVQLWTDAANMLQENPVVGTGFDTYKFLGRVGEYRDTHNYYMKVLVETGFVGLFLFLWLLKKMWGVGSALFRSAEDPFWASVGLGFLAMMGSVTVLNFFGDRWTFQQVTGVLWVLAGCCMRGLVLARQSNEQNNEEAELEESDEFSEVAEEVATA